MTQVPAPASLVAVAARVEARLDAVLSTETDRWSDLSPDLKAPLESLAGLVLGGGKRLRPAFCFWGFRAAGGDPDDERVIDAGAAFEMLQAFALVHDDVMDGSDTRRGERTAHLAHGDAHLDARWRGEARRYGEGVAILIGDLAHVYADRLVPDDAAVRAVWDELRLELNIGQYLDLLGTARGDTDLESATRIARYKSGKYTIERPLHLGASLAGRPDLHPTLSAYGDPLGEAFQLRDDVLGVFGDTATTGKPVGDDLREGKPTALLAHAHAVAPPPDLATLATVGHDLDDEQIAAVQQVLVDTGAVTAVEAMIDSLTARAVASLDTAPFDPEVTAVLVELAEFVAQRSA